MQMNEYDNSIALLQPNEPVKPSETDIVVDDSFYDGDVEIIRSEFISENNDTKPTVSFSKLRMYVNMFCIKLLTDTEYVQFLINKTKNQFAIKPCSEDDRDSFRWKSISIKSGKEVSRHISGPIFVAMLFDHMGWDTQYRYSLTGKLTIARESKLIVFDLNKYKAQFIGSSDKETTIKKTSYFPDSWKDSFGVPVDVHSDTLELSTFREYAVMSVSHSIEPSTDGTTETEVLIEEDKNNEAKET